MASELQHIWTNLLDERKILYISKFQATRADRGAIVVSTKASTEKEATCQWLLFCTVHWCLHSLRAAASFSYFYTYAMNALTSPPRTTVNFYHEGWCVGGCVATPSVTMHQKIQPTGLSLLMHLLCPVQYNSHIHPVWLLFHANYVTAAILLAWCHKFIFFSVEIAACGSNHDAHKFHRDSQTRSWPYYCWAVVPALLWFSLVKRLFFLLALLRLHLMYFTFVWLFTQI